MAIYGKNELERARRVKEEELYIKEGYKKAVLLGRNWNDYTNHLFAFLIDLNICLIPVYLWGVEFILILSGVISPVYFDLLFYLMYGLLFLTSCILLPLYTAAKGGQSWGDRYLGLRLVRADKKPASAIRLVCRQLFGFGIPMMVFGYFFSIFGVVGWWLVDGLVALCSPHQQTIFDWVFNLVDVYVPRYDMKVIKEPEAKAQNKEAAQPLQAAPQKPAASLADGRAEGQSQDPAALLAAKAAASASPVFSPNAKNSTQPASKAASSSQPELDGNEEPTRREMRKKEKRARKAEKEKEKQTGRNPKKEGSQEAGQAEMAALAAAASVEAAVQEDHTAQQEKEDLPISRIDLHIRSNFSDDSDVEVEDIFLQAREKGIDVISITDHNNARSNALAMHFARLYGVRYIPGVEIDCQLFGQRVRILGYYINWNDPFFDGIERLSLKREKDISEARIKAFEKETDLKIDTDSLLASSRFKIMTSDQLTDLVFDSSEARELPLVRDYLATSPSEEKARKAFEEDYFGPGGPCRIKAEYPGALKVIEAIHKAGGMAILSGWHLERISNDVIEGLLAGGIDGFEVFAPNNSDQTKAFLLSLVNEEKLFITAGSDYHGRCRKDRHLGVTTATPKGEQFVSIFTRALDRA